MVSPTVDCKVNATAALMLSDHYIRRTHTGEEDEDEEDEEDEDEDEESEEGSEVEQAAGGTQQPELTRTERRQLKKKQAAQKQEGGEEGEDADLINPNHVEKKLNISDLGAPRELTRRERCAIIILSWFWPEQLSFREQKEKQEAKDRYWKVTWFAIRP